MSLSATGQGPVQKAHVPHVEVIVTESFDVSSIARIDDLLTEALALNPAELVVDLEQCPRVDAAAIGLLLEVHRRAFRAGGALTLRSPSGQLRRNLRLAKADQVLKVVSEPAPSVPPVHGPVAPAPELRENPHGPARIAQASTWR